MSLVVLFRAATGERDLAGPAVPGKVSIQESTIVVGIDPNNREGKVFLDPVDGLPHRVLAAVGEDLKLTPTCVDVQSFERVQVLALGALPKVAQDPPPKTQGQ